MVGNVARPVNKQIFKVEFQKIFLFFLTVFFCCNVGESDLVLKLRFEMPCFNYNCKTIQAVYGLYPFV